MMEKNYKLIINLDKTKSNCKEEDRYCSEGEMILEEEIESNLKWIGKSICVQSMQITPLFQYDQSKNSTKFCLSKDF